MTSLYAQETATDVAFTPDTTFTPDTPAVITTSELVQDVPTESIESVPTKDSGEVAAVQTPSSESKPGSMPESGKSAVAPVMRPTSLPEPPNRKEFDIKADEQGMVQFNFRNQPWPDLLQWLASTSNMSLDWQQLPGDFVNLATTRPYTLEETRDLVNRLLLLRGYTMLEIDDVILVTKTDGINPALVPQVRPEQLATLPPNRFVRTSFALDFLLAEEIAEELKDLKSNNGRITPLSTTNRLEVMDAVVVLRGIKGILDEEQSMDVRTQLAKEFVLKHTRASVVKEQLEAFLGKKQEVLPNFNDPNQMQQYQQQMQQMQQMMQQQNMEANPAQVKKKERPTDVYLIANARQNSIIVHAPPQKMAIVEALIERLDVPSSSDDNLQSMLNGVKVYRLSTIDPQQLVASLLAMDALEPTTRLEADTKNKSLVAYASLADQYTIAKVIEKLDGSAREFDVLQLRRLDAEEVAGTIRFLMGVAQEDESKTEDDDYFYSYSYYDRNQNSKETGKKDRFRVGANSRDNQLLVWANEKEREEINKLLIKLGETPPAGGFTSKTRMIEANRSQETLEYLQKIKDRWKQMSDAPLILPDPSEFRSSLESPAAETTAPSQEPEQNKAPKKAPDNVDQIEEDKKQKPAETTEEKITSSPLAPTPFAETIDTENKPESNRSGPIGQLVQQDELTPSEQEAIRRVNPSGKKNQNGTESTSTPPISIQFDQDGNLIVQGDDPRALDILEEMMIANPPPSRPFTVFQITHTRASWIVINLKEYFSDEEKTNERTSGTNYYLFDRPEQKKTIDPQLSSKKKVKFVYDIDTNTVIVRNADNQQLKLIEELIKLWDTPARPNDRNLRYIELVRVQYSKANSIVEAVKDAYRDLLSSNDKAFQQSGGPENGNNEQKRDRDDSVVRNGAVNFKFEGKLSLGVDPVTNSVLVSAQGKDLLELIVKMVKELDEAAKPAGAIAVVRLPGNTNNQAILKAMRALTGNSSQGQIPDENAVNGGEAPQKTNKQSPNNLPENQRN